MIPTRAYPPMVDPALSESLRVASTAAEALKKLDIDVFAARARRGHLPELFVSALPAGVEFGLQARHPEANGDVMLVHVALWAGVRLIWRHSRPAPAVAEVAHA